MGTGPERVAALMGGTPILGRRIRTATELREAVQKGLPVEALSRVAEAVAGYDLGATQLKYQIVPKATLHRRTDRLSLEESERLERLARLMALAEEVWEDVGLAREFMNGVQPQLGNERPVDLARTELGGREVEELLMKIEYALPA